MTFVSFAQNFEDVMLWSALKDVEGGFYIDAGAAEPEEFSVTHAFTLRGWHGINIEPAHRPFRQLSQARPATSISVQLLVERQVNRRFTGPNSQVQSPYGVGGIGTWRWVSRF